MTEKRQRNSDRDCKAEEQYRKEDVRPLNATMRIRQDRNRDRIIGKQLHRANLRGIGMSSIVLSPP